MSSDTDHIVHFLEERVEGRPERGIAIRFAQESILSVAHGCIADKADDRFDQWFEELDTVGAWTCLGLRVIADEASTATPELMAQMLIIDDGTNPLMFDRGICCVLHHKTLASQEGLGGVADWSRQAERGSYVYRAYRICPFAQCNQRGRLPMRRRTTLRGAL
jgi:hypothetical protein